MAISRLMVYALLIHSVISSKVLQENNNIEVTELNANASVFFREIGKLFTYTEEWNIITYVDLDIFDNEFEYLIKLKTNIADLCHKVMKTLTNTRCMKVVNEFNLVIKEITKEQSIINHYIGSKRQKRSLIDGMGHVIKILFGNLDAEDAKYYDQQIEYLSKETEHLNEVARKQTTILESTYNLINSTIAQVEKHYKELRVEIAIVRKEMEDFWSIYKNTRAMHLMFEITELLTLQLTSVQNRQNSLLQIILSAITGKLHPYLIDPQTLETEMFRILPSLPPDVFIAGTKHFFDISTLYQMMTVDATRLNGKIIFRISVPLLKVTQMTMYELVALPVRIKNDLYSIVHPENNLLIIDLKNEFYAMESLNIIRSCMLVDRFYICIQNFPLLNSHSYKTCELNLYNSEDPGETCNRNTIRIENPVYIKLKGSNSWLYSIPEPEQLNVICNDNGNKIIITGKGLLKIKGNCVIHTRGVKLFANTVRNTTVQDNYFVSLSRAANETYEKVIMDLSLLRRNLTDNKEGIKIIKEGEGLTNLGKDVWRDLKELKYLERKGEENIKPSIRHPEKHFYFIYTLISVMMGILLIKCIHLLIRWRKKLSLNRITTNKHVVTWWKQPEEVDNDLELKEMVEKTISPPQAGSH